MLSFRATRGSVLLLSVWATAALTAVGIAQATRVSLQAKWSGRLQEGRQAWILAHTAVETAAAALAQDPPEVDSLNEAWARFPAEGVDLSPAGRFRYTVKDEQAYLPLNGLPVPFLARLPGFSQPVAEELVGLRETGHLILHPAELKRLAGFGFDGSELPFLAQHATAHDSGPVNLNTASGAVLEALGLPLPLVERILLYRAGLDGLPGTEDDGVFESAQTATVGIILQEATGYELTPGDQSALDALTAGNPVLLDVRSSLFRVEAEGVGWAGIRKKVTAVVDRQGKILGWYEE